MMSFLADLPLILTILSAVALFATCVLSCAATLHRRRRIREGGNLTVAVAEEVVRGVALVADDPTEDGCCYSRDDCDGPDCQCPCHDTAPMDTVSADELARLASDLVTVAEEWSRSPRFLETAFPAAGDLMGLAQHVGVDPQPTFGQERIYDADGMVPYGNALVELKCLNARRDAATDHVCDRCGNVFAAEGWSA